VVSELSDREYNFPEHICSTFGARLDMVVLGEGRRRVWLLRLTICYKLNTEDASVNSMI